MKLLPNLSNSILKGKIFPKKDKATYTLPIRSWAVEDRPREKLQQKGQKNLSNAELLAVLLGSGSNGESALALARRILASFNQNLTDLAKAEVDGLQQFKGVGLGKASKIMAALELGKRRQFDDFPEKESISCSQDAFRLIAPHLIDLPHEEFWIILLNRANRVLKYQKISAGGVSGTIVDAKLVFSKALQLLACSIILIHNHPSGAPRSADE